MNPLSAGAPPPGTPPDATCARCVWLFHGGRGPAVPRCRRHRDQRLDPASPPCASFTPAVDCEACGACCREAYHAVEVSRRDPFVRGHRALLVEVDGRLTLPRPAGRCACLEGRLGAYACVAYADRPRTCRDFTAGSANCLEARRRVALTP